LGVDLRGGIEAKKLSLRTKVVGRIHFAKPKNSHEVNTVLPPVFYYLFVSNSNSSWFI
jgi:hypothetical protein